LCDDVGNALCPRADGAGSAGKYGEYGFLYLAGNVLQPLPVRRRRPPAAPKPSPGEQDHRWGPLADRWQAAGADRLRILAKQVSTPQWILESLGIGWDGHAWTVPERNAAGMVVGIQRRFPNGDKRHHAGGFRGLTYCSDTIPRLPAAEVAVLVEGMTDVSAGRMLFGADDPTACVVGRPSAGAGTDDLAEMLELAPTARIIVLVENDKKPGGAWPGKAGAEKVAGDLARRLGRPIETMLVPDDEKDLRSWVSRYGIDPERFWLQKPLVFKGETDFCSRCYYKSGVGNSNGNTARPELPQYAGHRCPRSPWFAGVKAGGLAAVAFKPSCQNRRCPACGPVWTERNQLWLQWFFTTSETWHRTTCPRRDWKRIYRRIRRADPGARYVRIETGPGEVLTIFSSVAIAGSEPITQAAAVDQAPGLIGMTRHVSKPVTYSRGYGVGAADPKAVEPSPVAEHAPKHAAGTAEPSTPGRIAAPPPPPKFERVFRLPRGGRDELIAAIQYAGCQILHVDNGATSSIEFDLPEGQTADQVFAAIKAGMGDVSCGCEVLSDDGLRVQLGSIADG